MPKSQTDDEEVDMNAALRAAAGRGPATADDKRESSAVTQRLEDLEARLHALEEDR
jgi:hypothetical protein